MSGLSRIVQAILETSKLKVIPNILRGSTLKIAFNALLFELAATN